jgi:hypothetical protein
MHPTATWLLYSPQRVLQGNLSPHTFAGGRDNTFNIHYPVNFTEDLLEVYFLYIGREHSDLPICAPRGEQGSIRVPINRKDRTPDRPFDLLEANQFISSSNEHTQMHRAPLATANLFSKGLQRICVAARLIFRTTSVGFHVY